MAPSCRGGRRHVIVGVVYGAASAAGAGRASRHLARHPLNGAGLQQAGVAVDFADRLGQGEPVGKPAVGLDGEGDRHRQAGGAGGLHDPDRLAGAGEG
jgi:hypothetical protein